jgi:hypothetical protein
MGGTKRKRAGAHGRRDGVGIRGRPGCIGAARIAIPNDLVEIAEAPALVPAARCSVQGETRTVHERHSVEPQSVGGAASRCAASTKCTVLAR